MIPAFTVNGLLPAFTGSTPAELGGRAPFRTSIIQVIDRFATSPERIAILSGLLDYRRALYNLGLVTGFQWINGSFVEDIERLEGRPPGDVDIVTFFRRPAAATTDIEWAAFQANNKPRLDELFLMPIPKQKFKCDAYPVELEIPPELVVFWTHYWFGLFSHRRATFEWKGLLQVPLFTAADDDAARQLLAVRMGP